MLDAKIQMLSPKGNGLLIITKSTDVTISALFLFLIFTSIILTATEQIVNHLTKIFY